MGKNMVEKGLGILGIATAALPGAVEYFFPLSPSWIAPLGHFTGVLLLGLSVGLMLAGGIHQKRTIRPKASLSLHSYGDHQVPTRINQENIFRYYFLSSIDTNTGLVNSSTLFIIFEDDVRIHTLRISSPDMQIPFFEAKEYCQRYAIIFFYGRVPIGTLNIESLISD